MVLARTGCALFLGVQQLASVPLECTIQLEYPSEREAETIRRAIELDNDKYADAERRGKVVVIRSSSESVPSMLHTLEDLLACVRIAEETLTIAGGGSSDDPLSDLDR
ncbi:MAG: hypothetical protein LUQ55_01535 [Methanomassiliicoccales archaeon]|nr:hypothetical protein [Methanomassiliicoccales archaeon]